MTDKQPQTCYVITSQEESNVSYKLLTSNTHSYYVKELKLRYIHTPEELAKTFREVAEKAIEWTLDNVTFEKNGDGYVSLPDKDEYLNQHYPLP